MPLHGKKVLFARGSPFLVLATQAEDHTMVGPTEAAARQFAYARALGCNTIEVQVKWAMVEPRKDEYTMEWVRWVLEQARAHDLNLVLLWFGSNVVGQTDGEHGLRRVPQYVGDDTKTYARLGIGLGGTKRVLDPANPSTLDREKKAFRRTLEYVRSSDTEGRVLMWQILNEVGVWPHTVVPYSDAELTRNLARYVDELARVEKDVLGLPAFANFWEGLRGADPAYFIANCPNLDFVAPDLYGSPKKLFGFTRQNYEQFRSIFHDALERYSRGRNVFFLSETNTDAFYRSDLSLMYLLGKAGGIGMDVWAMTTATPDRGEALVDRESGRLTPSGERLREVYSAVGAAMGPIAGWAGTSRSAWLVSEGGGHSSLRAGPFSVEVACAPGGAVLLVAPPEGDLIIVGAKAKVRLPLPADDHLFVVEQGAWVGADQWRPERTFPATTAGAGLEIQLDRYTSLRVGTAPAR